MVRRHSEPPIYLARQSRRHKFPCRQKPPAGERAWLNVDLFEPLTRQVARGWPVPRRRFRVSFAFVLTRIVQTGEEPVKVALRLASLDL